MAIKIEGYRLENFVLTINGNGKEDQLVIAMAPQMNGVPTLRVGGIKVGVAGDLTMITTNHDLKGKEQIIDWIEKTITAWTCSGNRDYHVTLANVRPIERIMAAIKRAGLVG